MPQRIVVVVVIMLTLNTLLSTSCSIGTAENRSASGLIVDFTQDNSSMGFPAQRKLAYDSRGNLYVAYRKLFKAKLSNQYHIFVAKSVDNGRSWVVMNENAPIEDTGDYNQRVPSIAIDMNDVIHVTWYGNDVNNTGKNERQIKYVRSMDSGATWTRWRNIAEIKGYDDSQPYWQEHPTLTTRGNQVFVVWQGRDEMYRAKSQIKFARSTDSGQTWLPHTTIQPDANASRSRPDVIVTRDGSRLFALAYGEWDGRMQIVWTSSADRGDTWTAWQPVAPSWNDQRHISTVVDASNHLHAVWRESDASNRWRIYYSRFTGRVWEGRTKLSDDDTMSHLFPNLTQMRDGALVCVWTEEGGATGLAETDLRGGSVIYTKRSPRALAWSKPKTISVAGKSAAYVGTPRASLRPGTMMLVWQDNASDIKPIRFANVGLP
jgi:hypothetical protein